MSFSDFGRPQIDACMDSYYKKSAHMNVFKANASHMTILIMFAKHKIILSWPNQSYFDLQRS